MTPNFCYTPTCISFSVYFHDQNFFVTHQSVSVLACYSHDLNFFVTHQRVSILACTPMTPTFSYTHQSVSVLACTPMIPSFSYTHQRVSILACTPMTPTFSYTHQSVSVLACTPMIPSFSYTHQRVSILACTPMTPTFSYTHQSVSVLACTRMIPSFSYTHQPVSVLACTPMIPSFSYTHQPVSVLACTPMCGFSLRTLSWRARRSLPGWSLCGHRVAVIFPPLPSACMCLYSCMGTTQTPQFPTHFPSCSMPENEHMREFENDKTGSALYCINGRKIQSVWKIISIVLKFLTYLKSINNPLSGWLLHCSEYLHLNVCLLFFFYFNNIHMVLFLLNASLSNYFCFTGWKNSCFYLSIL